MASNNFFKFDSPISIAFAFVRTVRPDGFVINVNQN